MRWTEQQLAMLREMGVPPFWPQTPVGEPPVARASEPLPPTSPEPPEPTAARRPAAPASVAVPVAAPALHLDWPALRDAVQACQACGLSASRTQTVFGVGHPRAHWMLVGEAPGEQEDRQGEPFVGRAGQLLDRMLQAVGLTRGASGPEQQVYIANVIKCRPPQNRNPDPVEIAQCEPYLLRQIELVDPALIVLSGLGGCSGNYKFNDDTYRPLGDPQAANRGK